jgi:hypothetical protein
MTRDEIDKEYCKTAWLSDAYERLFFARFATKLDRINVGQYRITSMDAGD